MIAGLVYVLLYVAAAVPGLPIGWRMFGRDNATGWVAGAIVGYTVTALAIWIAIRGGIPSGLAFVAMWGLFSLATWLAVDWRAAPLFPVAPWRRADTIGLAGVLLLTLIVAVPPFARLGSRDAAGNRYYRAYFTADFVWHTALTGEIRKFSMPPRNPFLRHRAIHYYWTYFLVPAAISATGPGDLRDVEKCLKLNAVLTGMLLISALFVSVRAAVPVPAAVAVSVGLAFIAASAEGLTQIYLLWRDGIPFSHLAELNIDAISAWRWGGYRVDGLQRAIWYNPQHSMSGALGLVALTAAAAGGSGRAMTAGLLVGVALAGSVLMNPFVGCVFSLAYGVAAIVDALRQQAWMRSVLNSAMAVLPVLLALGWCVENDVLSGAGGALEFGFDGPSVNSPFLTLMVSLGPALVPAIGSLVVRSGPAWGPLVPAATIASLSLILMYFVRLSVDESWVGFRTGHLLLLSLPSLSARFFASTWPKAPVLAASVAAAVLVAGAPTLLIDAYNAQDIGNRSPGPGFPWTRVVTPAEQEAFRWIREQTPETATVQQDALARHPTTWWVVPTFGQRRMAAGLPPFMLDMPEYHEKAAAVRLVYATHDAAEANAVAHSLRIDYLYVDGVERQAYPGGVAKFDDARYFIPAFRNDQVAVYQVR